MADEIQDAKRLRSELQLHQRIGESVTLSFSRFFPPQENVRLFEVPVEVVKSIESGQPLSIKGENDTALCTAGNTFSIKKVETSNSVFLVPPSGQLNYEIWSKNTAFYELKLINPRLEKLLEILSPSQYVSDEDDMEYPKQNLLTYEELRAQIVASDAELLKGMERYRVLELKGKMRLISSIAYYDTVRNLIDTIMETSMPLDSVDENVLQEHLQQVERVLIQRCLHSLADQEPMDGNWILNSEKVAIATAHCIFTQNGSVEETKAWSKESFLNSWAARTPGPEPNEDLLKGVALLELQASTVTSRSAAITAGLESAYTYRYFPLEKLPHDPKSRFAELFAARARFRKADIEPYLVDLFGGLEQPKTLDALILQYARVVGDEVIAK